MSKKTDNTEEKIVAVEQVLSRTEQFFEKNQKVISISVGVIVFIVLAIFAFKRFYLEPKETEAQSQIFMAQQYFEKDSLNKAMNGDGNYLGFISIIDDYGMTKAANLSHYYLGVCYLKKGQFKESIDEFNDFSSNDKVLKPLSLSGIGDAYLELGETQKAIDYYKKASLANKNIFTAPQFLMKTALTYEILNDYENALKIYEQIKKDYFKSYEGRQIDKYIARAKGLISNK